MAFKEFFDLTNISGNLIKQARINKGYSKSKPL